MHHVTHSLSLAPVSVKSESCVNIWQKAFVIKLD